MSILTVGAFIVNILNSIAPKLADKLVEKHLSGKKVYIDRVIISQKDKSFIFDITSSSSIDQEVSINQLNVSLRKAGNSVGINGIKEISSKYIIHGQQGKMVAEVNQTIYSKQVIAWTSGNGAYFKLPILENQLSKSTNRFTVEWINEEDLTTFKTVSVLLEYSFLGKEKTTKKYELENPLWVDNGDATNKHRIYGSAY